MKSFIKKILPVRLHRFIVKVISSSKKYYRWGLILIGRTSRNKIRVFYGHDHIPLPGEYVHGGLVKFQRMQPVYPNDPRHFNILYMVSSSTPADWEILSRIAQFKGRKIVWNQDGVAYPAWYKGDYHKFNAPMRAMRQKADFVFYQSHFSKLSAEKFLGEIDRPWQILYNSVDTKLFIPAVKRDDRTLSLLLGGNQYEDYRLEIALLTLAELIKYQKNIKLYVTGHLSWDDKQTVSHQVKHWIDDLKLSDYVTFLGPYMQKDAPALISQMDILLHTKYNDPCPGIVIEAMACGLPVVYLSSGGVGELVGEEAGIGVAVPTSWDEILLPKPQALAQAVIKIAEHKEQYADAARQRTIDKFDLQPWLQEHKTVFERLMQ